MSNKYMKGFIAGSMLGMTVSLLLLPQINSQMIQNLLRKGKEAIQNYTNKIELDE